MGAATSWFGPAGRATWMAACTAALAGVVSAGSGPPDGRIVAPQIPEEIVRITEPPAGMVPSHQSPWCPATGGIGALTPFALEDGSVFFAASRHVYRRDYPTVLYPRVRVRDEKTMECLLDWVNDGEPVHIPKGVDHKFETIDCLPVKLPPGHYVLELSMADTGPKDYWSQDVVTRRPIYIGPDVPAE